MVGKTSQIQITNNAQNIANLVFFVTYIIFQPPSTILVRAIGPRIHLAAITLMWGAVMIGMGFVKNFSQLAALRAVLGLFEAGFFPSCVYLLSTWYTRCMYHNTLIDLLHMGQDSQEYHINYIHRRGRQTILGVLYCRMCGVCLRWYFGVWGAYLPRFRHKILHWSFKTLMLL